MPRWWLGRAWWVVALGCASSPPADAGAVLDTGSDVPVLDVAPPDDVPDTRAATICPLWLRPASGAVPSVSPRRVSR